MLTTPQVFTSIHDEEVTNLVTCQEESLRKLIQDASYLADLGTLGTVVWHSENQPGVPTLDLTIWQRCDGTQITNPLSPLRTIGLSTRFTPDLRNRYPQCHDSAIGSDLGGTQTYNLQHSHGGATGVACPPIFVEADGDRRFSVCHAHSIAEALSSPIVIDYPAYLHLSAFFKIS